MASHQLQLVSFDLCPYVERSRVVLEEKRLTYELTLIDLRHKPDWFLAISPMGKVPVLVVDGQPVFESVVINELIEELYPEPRLLPAEPLARAQARAWIIFCNDALMPHSLKILIGSDAERAGAMEALATAFGRLEGELIKRGTDYLVGETFSLVDAVYATFFGRFLAGGDPACVAQLARTPALARYAGRLGARESVQRSRPKDLEAKLQRYRAEHRAA
jgi:glutathione S-transferase